MRERLRLVELFTDIHNFRDGSIVSHSFVAFNVGIDANAQHLAHVVENHDRIGNQIIQNGHFQRILCWLLNRGLHIVYILVPDKSNSTSSKWRHAWQVHRLVAGHFGFDDLERIFGGLESFNFSAFVCNRGLVGKDSDHLTRVAA